MIKLAKRFVLVCIAIMIAVATAELGLRLVCRVYSPVNNLLSTHEVIPDLILKFRPRPGMAGLDELGFPNAGVVEKADVVCMGDSQCFGYRVRPPDAWPRQLEALIAQAQPADEQIAYAWSKLGLPKPRSVQPAGVIDTAPRPRIHSAGARPPTVYNMSFPMYSPLHSLRLLDEAYGLNPEVIVAAFYLGNDSHDSYTLVDFYHRTGRLSKSPCQVGLRDAIVEVDRNDSARSTPENIDWSKHRLPGGGLSSYKLFQIISLIYTNCEYQFGETPSRTLSGKVFWELIQIPSFFMPQQWVFDDGRFRTIFDSKFRVDMMNLEYRTVRCGLRLSLEALNLMAKRSKERNTEFVVLILPTKQMVFSELVQNHVKDSSKIPDTFLAVLKNEKILKEKTITYLTKNGIRYLDPVPVLRSCFEKGAQPFKVSVDDHPSVVGHAALANLVFNEITNLRDRK